MTYILVELERGVVQVFGEEDERPVKAQLASAERNAKGWRDCRRRRRPSSMPKSRDGWIERRRGAVVRGREKKIMQSMVVVMLVRVRLGSMDACASSVYVL